MPTARTSPRGTLGVTIKVPGNASKSNHEIAATNGTRTTGNGKGQVRKAPEAVVESVTVTTFATVMVTVVEAAPDPDPTATPKPDPTATPKPDPTATPKPDPTATPKPDPTATPKPDPTAPPPPDPTAPPPPDPGPDVTFEDDFGGSDLRSAWKAIYGPGDPGDRLTRTAWVTSAR